MTRSVLRLGVEIPIGDPGLVLPAIYQPSGLDIGNGGLLLIPHFSDIQTDDELCRVSGCTNVLRPNIQRDRLAVKDFIDRIVHAEFVLCGSLHGAIVAAAYNRPFAFWDSGQIDLPFKWADFSASVGIPCEFHLTVNGARRHYSAQIEPRISIPVLWPLLAAAPFPLRSDMMAQVMALDIEHRGTAALTQSVSSLVTCRVSDAIVARNQQEEVFERLTESQGTEIADLTKTVAERDGQIAGLVNAIASITQSGS